MEPNKCDDVVLPKISEEEERLSQTMYETHRDKYGLTEEQIHKLFKGKEKLIAERMKEVDDIHIRRVGNSMVVSRYSEEKATQNENTRNEINELKEEVKQLKEIILKKFGG